MHQLTDFFENLFSVSDWPPRWHCGQWSEFHGWLYIVSDLMIWAAYFTIPVTIIRFISRKQDMRFTRLYFLFAAFILACGATHFFDALAFWLPMYRFSALIRLITGIISWITVFYLVRYLPLLFSLKSQNALEAEINLRKISEEKFKAVLEASPDAMVIVNSDGQIVLVNKQTEDLLGYHRKQLVHQPVDILVPQEIRENFTRLRAAYLLHPRIRALAAGIQTWVLTEEGISVPVEINFSPLMVNGEMLVMGSLRDITVRRQTAELLEKTRVNFEMLVNGVKDYAIFMVDRDGLINSWNEGAAKIKGYSGDEVIGQPTAIFYTDADRASGLPTRNLAMAMKEGTFETEGLRVRKDGSVFLANIVFTKLTDAKGNFAGFAKVIKDITQFAKDQEKIQFLASITENIQDPIITADSENCITRWNNAAERLLGWSSAEVLGKKTSEVLNVLYPAASREEIFSSLSKNKNWHGEVVYHTRDGKPLTVLVTLSLLFDNKSAVTGNLALIKDISSRVDAENALKILNGELARANGEMEAFSYSVSHDLRAPLRAIGGYTRMLEDGGTVVDQDAVRLMHNIIRYTDKMGILIDGLLNFSRLGRKELIKINVDLTPLVNHLCAEAARHFPDRMIHFTIAPLPVVWADHLTIENVWENLISNAVKYTAQRDRSIISIGCVEEESKYTFHITDNGDGFDMQYAGKLFGVFQRLHAEKQFPGTGVGLALVHRIITKHGGSIWADATPEMGATFYFTLPKQ
ncbi:MAG: PAS domain S-box protein [Chitinophagaceae bacterium]